VKLLAAARPLSVQIHPNAQQAMLGWQRQQAGTGPSAYSDPFEKTEMLVALTAFDALVGWRDTAQALAIVEQLPGMQAVGDALRGGNREDALRAALTDSNHAAIAKLPAAIAAVGGTTGEQEAYALISREYPDDAGAVVTVLLQYVHLLPGQAAYVPAGIPHSYIQGTGLEVMTSSDNVLRLGLTTKPVFVEEAISALQPIEPMILDAAFGDILWPVNAPFVVRVLADGSEKLPTGAYRIVLNIEGSASLHSDLGDMTLRPGTAAVMAAEDPDAWGVGRGRVAVVQATTK
jgi:mannose-6-phosphate isomerase